MFNLIESDNLPFFLISLGFIAAGIAIIVVAAHRAVSLRETGEQ